MSPDEQILGVVKIIKQAEAVNPAGKAFRVALEKLRPYPDHAAILSKLQAEHNALSILQRPNAKGLSEIDLNVIETMGEMSETATQDYMSYRILALPKFPKLYDKLSASLDTTKSLLEPGSYDAANGVLTINGQRAYIIKQPNMKGASNEKNPAKLMRLLFSVKTFSNAVPIRKIFPVKSEKYPPSIIKRANALVTDINERIQESRPVNKVVGHDGFKFYIESSYLK